MKRHASKLLTILAASAALALSAQPGGAGHAPAHPAPVECEGDACAAVTLAFDEAGQRHRAQNNSADRWARVSAANLAAAASACVRPGGVAYLPLKSVVGSYRAAYAPEGCPSDGGGR